MNNSFNEWSFYVFEIAWARNVTEAIIYLQKKIIKWA